MSRWQEADGTLDCISMALTCTFNRWGTLLAVGCNDGRIVLSDFLTRGIAKIISAHIHPLVSASTDNIPSLFRFPLPILKFPLVWRFSTRFQNHKPKLSTDEDGCCGSIRIGWLIHSILGFCVQENWSAFAPDFKELDENVEYEERTLLLVRDLFVCAPGADAAEDEEVDARQLNRNIIATQYCVSDKELEDFKALFYLPIAPEAEDPEENPFDPPPDAAVQTATTEDGSSHTGRGQEAAPAILRRSPAQKEGPYHHHHRATREVHPLLGVKGDSKSKKKKTAGRPKGSKGKEKDFPFRNVQMFAMEIHL
uniref:Retinoblastoma-binding protein 5 n=1 Tax=Oncorhynchus kisutch TaxID=8019 RepID=A0A8C7DK48_ONCKI